MSNSSTTSSISASSSPVHIVVLHVPVQSNTKIHEKNFAILHHALNQQNEERTIPLYILMLYPEGTTTIDLIPIAQYYAEVATLDITLDCTIVPVFKESEIEDALGRIGNNVKSRLQGDFSFVLYEFEENFATLLSDFLSKHSQFKVQKLALAFPTEQSKQAVEAFNLSQSNTITLDKYESVAVGGTFDHIHFGHKVLLLQQALASNNRVISGVVGEEEMLKSKKVKELILPFEKRRQDVHNYYMLIKPALNYDIFRLKDPFGPTITDATCQAISASPETIVGVQKINQIRTEKGMKPLDALIIPLVNPRNEATGNKVSSTDLRVKLQKKTELQQSKM